MNNQNIQSEQNIDRETATYNDLMGINEVPSNKTENVQPEKKKHHWLLKLGVIGIIILALLGVGAYLGAQFQLNSYKILLNVNHNFFFYITIAIVAVVVVIAAVALAFFIVHKYHQYKEKKLVPHNNQN